MTSRCPDHRGRSQHCLGMTLDLDLAPDPLNHTVHAHQIGGAHHAHIAAAIVLLLGPDSQRVGQPALCSIAGERHRQTMFGDETLMLCRSEEHTSELQSLMRISYAVFCLKKK